MLCAGAFGASAQGGDKATQVISALTSKLKAMKAYGADITMNVGGVDVKGRFVVAGDSYRLTLDDMGVSFSDGKTKYEANHDSQEVVISSIGVDDNDMFTNPARALNFPQSMFSYAYKGEQMSGGKKCDVVELTPKKEGQNIMVITLRVDKAASVPVSMTYNLEGFDDMRVSITNFGDRTASPSDFKYNKADYKGYEIIDFR